MSEALNHAEYLTILAHSESLPFPDRIELTEAGAIFHFDDRGDFGEWCDWFGYSPVGHTRLTAEFKADGYNVSGVYVKEDA